MATSSSNVSRHVVAALRRLEWSTSTWTTLHGPRRISTAKHNLPLRQTLEQRSSFSTTASHGKPVVSANDSGGPNTAWRFKTLRSWQWPKASTVVGWMVVGGAVAISACFLLPYAMPAAHAESPILLQHPNAVQDHQPSAYKASKSHTDTGTGKSTGEESTTISNATVEIPTLRKIRLSEIQEHGKDADNVWVVRGTRVYDITDWIPNHPGGPVILKAAGGDVSVYWKLFSVHEKEDVYEILEQYLIGEVDDRDLVDGKIVWTTGVDNPFASDPARDARLFQHSARPCNAETPGTELRDFVTPNEIFYVRNHFWVPEASAAEHSLTIEREDGTEIVYTLDELKARFPKRTITATLQCSGNRRSHMTKAVGKTNGIQWDVGAIGNAVWSGVMLRDILSDTGFPVDDVPGDVRHAHFAAEEAYAASIPIEKAVDKRGDVLLAYEMNGEPLPRDHGFPLRVVVPGHVAARSVKWLNRITLSDEESSSQWQRRDYKLFGPNVGANPDWDSAPAIQETPVQSAVTRMSKRAAAEGFNHPDDECIVVEGYAFAGGGRHIARVDISTDGGQTWDQAELLKPAGKEHGPKQSWAWQRWEFTVPQKSCGSGFVVKAVDEGYNSQPAGFAGHYTQRGNLATGWHEVDLRLTPTTV